jgi:hypothetical protein
MARNRPGSAKNEIRQQEAAFRRGAPGAKQFIGGTADQSRAARQAERRKVERMAEIDHADRVAKEVGTPVSAILAELVQDSLRLAWTAARAPFRIARALLIRRPRTA